MKNLWAKTRGENDPYLTVKQDNWTWKVLKAYQSNAKERRNPFARWLCAVQSPMTFGSWDFGDTYIHDIPIDAAAQAVLDARLKEEEK